MRHLSNPRPPGRTFAAVVGGLAACLLVLQARAGTPGGQHQYGPAEALGALHRADPQPHWLANGKLAYRGLANGKPQERVFDSASGEVTAPGGAPAPPSGARVVAPGIFGYSPPVREVASPDGAWFAGTRNGNLYLRPAAGQARRHGSPVAARRKTAIPSSGDAGPTAGPAIRSRASDWSSSIARMERRAP